MSCSSEGGEGRRRRRVEDVGAAERAGDVLLEPEADALGMERVRARREEAEGVVVFELEEAHRALQRVAPRVPDPVPPGVAVRHQRQRRDLRGVEPRPVAAPPRRDHSDDDVSASAGSPSSSSSGRNRRRHANARRTMNTGKKTAMKKEMLITSEKLRESPPDRGGDDGAAATGAMASKTKAATLAAATPMTTPRRLC